MSKSKKECQKDGKKCQMRCREVRINVKISTIRQEMSRSQKICQKDTNKCQIMKDIIICHQCTKKMSKISQKYIYKKCLKVSKISRECKKHRKGP